MSLTTISLECGNLVCQAGESFVNCAKDCSPMIIDYFNCVVGKGACPLVMNVSFNKIFFVLLIGVFIFYLVKRGGR